MDTLIIFIGNLFIVIFLLLVSFTLIIKLYLSILKRVNPLKYWEIQVLQLRAKLDFYRHGNENSIFVDFNKIESELKEAEKKFSELHYKKF